MTWLGEQRESKCCVFSQGFFYYLLNTFISVRTLILVVKSSVIVDMLSFSAVFLIHAKTEAHGRVPIDKVKRGM